MATQPEQIWPTKNDGTVVSITSRTSSLGAQIFSEKTGGPPTDGGDSWKNSVETRLGELRTDVRHLLIGGGFIALALLAAGWQTYQAAMNQMREIAVRQSELSGKIDTMDARIGGKFETLGARMDNEGRGKAANGK